MCVLPQYNPKKANRSFHFICDSKPEKVSADLMRLYNKSRLSISFLFSRVFRIYRKLSKIPFVALRTSIDNGLCRTIKYPKIGQNDRCISVLICR